MIFFVGYYGFGNIGDEAILSSTLAQFRARRADLRIVVASGNPQHTIDTHGVEAIAWNDMGAIHRAVQVADLVVIGGGGLFHDYWGVDPDTFLTNRHWGVAYYAGPAALATLYRKPVMLYGVGVGPLYSAHGINYTRMVAQAAKIITVRDQASKAALEEIGILSESIRVTADPAFTFVPSEAYGLQDAVGPDFVLHKPVLGVAARHWGIGVFPEFLEREIASAIDLFLKQTGGSAVLLPFQDISGERENDRATAQRILSHIRLTDRVVVAHESTSPDRVYGCLRESSVILGMRLHSLIFAALNGVPSVSLSYDPKVDALSEHLGRQFSLDVKNIEAPLLTSRLLEALQQGDHFREVMHRAKGELREAAAQNASLALSLLDALPGEAGPRLKSFDLLRCQSAEQESLTLNRELAEARARYQAVAEAKSALEASLRSYQDTITGLQGELASLHSRLQAETDRRRSLETANTSQKQEAEQDREAILSRQAAVVAELDRFRAAFLKDLEIYRQQRAWKIMLFVRKAYTMLFREPIGRFLGWALGVPFGRIGRLDDYELVFPDVANYIPDSFRHQPLPETPLKPAPVPLESAFSEPDTAPQGNQFDLVILAIIDFDFRFQRPQQIAAEFARRGHRVFWISPTRFLPPASPIAYETVRLRDNLWEIHLRARQPDIYLGELKPDHIHAMSSAFEELHRDWTIGAHTVLVQLPFWRKLALEFRTHYGSNLLYDCMDDWETFENMGSFNVTEEKDLVRECDVLVVTGAELQKKFEAQGLHPLLARNGADYPFFSQARPNHLLAGVPRPIVGYFGAIADWIDLDLVYEVAKSRPQYSFVLIGQVFGRDTKPLESLPNVRLLGNKAYSDIPAYLYNFDACLIPFLLNQVTKATDPVKLYEYFSLGKPVVATDMKELGQCGDLLYIGKDAEDFAQKLDLAVTEKDDRLTRGRIDFAKANTWSSRVQDIDQAIRDSFPLVSILIVTHNSSPFVRPCLDSLFRNTSYPRFEVIVVDNASTDDTPAQLQRFADLDSRVFLTVLPQNLGFAGGNNRAAQQAKGEYLVFLNIDTMVTVGWIEWLLRHFCQNPAIGLLCPVTNFAGNEVKINVRYNNWREMERFARGLAVSKRGLRLEIGVAPLYCAMMPRAVWEQVGELDARYEIGMFEDDDLSLRVRKAGFGVYAAEDCFIHHFGQGSFSKLPGETYNRIFEANRKRFEEKWKLPWQAHRTRPGVRPPFEEKRFEPQEFSR